jgi:starch synthase
LGIRNGIDTDVWNPRTDSLISSPFDLSSLASRQPNKTALQQRFNLTRDPNRLLFGVVSRLAWQKGMDILSEAVPALVELGAQLVVLGTGDWESQNRMRSLASAYRDQVGCIMGYDEELAHLVQAGADALLVPSRFEPCGLTQLCAMRYGPQTKVPSEPSSSRRNSLRAAAPTAGSPANRREGRRGASGIGTASGIGRGRPP